MVHENRNQNSAIYEEKMNLDFGEVYGRYVNMMHLLKERQRSIIDTCKERIILDVVHGRDFLVK